jgi:phage pi2 protein 07
MCRAGKDEFEMLKSPDAAHRLIYLHAQARNFDGEWSPQNFLTAASNLSQEQIEKFLAAPTLQRFLS